MTSQIKRSAFAILLSALGVAGCGDVTGRSSTRLVVDTLNASSATTGSTGATLESDVLSVTGGVHSDSASVKFSLIMRDPVNQSPSDLNQVTITRYHVSYRRSDGRAVQGVDVPYAFDSAFTVTVPGGGSATAGFELVRLTAKEEAPLRALGVNNDVLHVIADVMFYGQDLSGNDVSASASIGITFANFADAAQ